MKITSVNNELVKDIAKLLQNKHRKNSELFIIEGEKGVEEAIHAGLKIKYIFKLEGFSNFCGDNVIETNEAVLSKISDAKSAPKIIAVALKPQISLENLKDAKRVVLLENIKDAGNLGTILRTAAAFNIDGIVLYGDTVDLYNPKCVRSAVGNLWKIPVYEIKEIDELTNLFYDYEKIATLPIVNNVIKLNDYTPAEKVLIMFGSEAEGLSNELKDFATKNLTIEKSPSVESLNLSVSVSIIMYKLSFK